MRLNIDFPSVIARDGPAAVVQLAQAIEHIGFHELDIFDHVVMGYPSPDRAKPRYPSKMPILEALTTLSYLASVTREIRLGTEVLVLPQRQPALVAKQVSTLDTLSGGRVRLGVGVGWQDSEYHALDEEFTDRGQRMDEAIELLRHYWRDEQVNFDGLHYQATAMAMEPKSPQAGKLPIWIGGGAPAALRRVGTLGDGWMAMAFRKADAVNACKDIIEEAALAAGRDPGEIGYQCMFDLPPVDAIGKAFFADMDQVAARAVEVREQGFEMASINGTAVFQAGARSVPAMIESLGRIFERVQSEVG